MKLIQVRSKALSALSLGRVLPKYQAEAKDAITDAVTYVKRSADAGAARKKALALVRQCLRPLAGVGGLRAHYAIRLKLNALEPVAQSVCKECNAAFNRAQLAQGVCPECGNKVRKGKTPCVTV
jgi:hypothetical protein